MNTRFWLVYSFSMTILMIYIQYYYTTILWVVTFFITLIIYYINLSKRDIKQQTLKQYWKN